jgi:hypothetical protein
MAERGPRLETVVRPHDARCLSGREDEQDRVLTSVLVVPYYHPIRLAKALATLDVVSGGRIWLGVGAGWMPAEFKRLGISLVTWRHHRQYLRATIEPGPAMP